MKILKTVSMMFAAVVFVSAATAQAQTYRAPNSAPARTFLGLPVPQQWSGAASQSRNTSYAAGQTYNSNGLSSPQCANGECLTGNYQARYGANGNCANGRCTTGSCNGCNCPAGACANGLCATGQCPACANGECVGCANGQCATRSCPNGQCPRNQFPTARSNSGMNYGVQGNWDSRTTRSNMADPFRGVDVNGGNDDWTPRAATRIQNNVLSPSRYNPNDLDLRRPYFNNQSGELNDTRSGDTNSVSRDIRAPRPSERSMFGAPIDRAAGFAQI